MPYALTGKVIHLTNTSYTSFVSQVSANCQGHQYGEYSLLLVGMYAFVEKPDHKYIVEMLLIMVVVELSLGCSERAIQGKTPSPRRC